MKFAPTLTLLAVTTLPAIANFASLQSPGGQWSATIPSTDPLVIELRDRSGKLLVSQQARMVLETGELPAKNAKIVGTHTRVVDDTIEPPVRQTAAKLRDRYAEATLDFDDNSSLIVRLYDEGLAYRFATKTNGEITVLSEERVCRFEGDPTVWFGNDPDFFSHNEVAYEVRKLSELKPGAMASLPLTVRPAGGEGLLVFSESDLQNYPGQWMVVGDNTLDGVNPGYPAEETEDGDRNHRVSKREAWIAKVKGPRAFPWRTVAAAEKDFQLVGNTLNFLVAEPSRIADASWIRPGLVQWDWWHDFTWDGEKQPISNETYKRYIDFASEKGVPYVILDEGWYELDDLTKEKPGIDIAELVEYGNSKNVGLILWATSLQMKKRFDDVMPMFENWGVKGLKVDFFQRDDQKEVEFYWKLAEEAAKRNLLLDVHGAHKPAGIQRTWPNVLTFEGVLGLEQSKWSKKITPTHDLELPFTRQVAGPHDYTPGAMRNAQPDAFEPEWAAPGSQGTRARELAKYVVFESPLQMLCDAPPHYAREKETMEFLTTVPTQWDETKPLGGKIGEHVEVARRNGDTWYLAAMTNGEAREIEFDLAQLGDGDFEVTVWQDGPDAGTNATSFEKKTLTVKAGEKLPAVLAPNGGWVGVARPAK